MKCKKTNKYKQQNGNKDKGKGNTINYYVHKHLFSGLRWLFLNNFPGFFRATLFVAYWTLCLLHCSQTLYLYLVFIFSFWGVLSCQQTPFQALSPTRKITKEENYKSMIRQTKLSLSNSLNISLLPCPWIPPCRVKQPPPWPPRTKPLPGLAGG